MKILFMGFAVSNHTKRWINTLADLGHEVFLVCQPDKKDNENAISPKVKIHYLKFAGKLGYYLNVHEVKNIFKKYRPDVVNAHFATGYGTTARLAKLKPLVVSCWGSDVYDFPYHSKLNKYILCKNLRNADAVASTSHAMAEQVRSLLNEPDKKVHVTPFGISTDLFKPSEKKHNNTSPIIGIVKYLEPIYDIGLLIDAFSIVLKISDINPVLHIYGGGSQKEHLERQCRKLGIADQVTFFGTIPNKDIPKALSTFDVFVNCSRHESFGVAVVEAMASKIPVVVTDTPGYREIVENGKCGIILKDRNPETMAHAIIRLLSDKALASRYARSGFDKVHEEYDWNQNVRKMIEIYNSIIVEAEY